MKRMPVVVIDSPCDVGAAAGMADRPAWELAPGSGFAEGAEFEEWLALAAAEAAGDAEPPPDPKGEAGRPEVGPEEVAELYAPSLDALLDVITEDESVLAMRAARRARSVERARMWALTSDEFVLPNSRMSESERFEWTMRCFLTEIATRQRMSEAMAGRLVEESRVLVTELPETLQALECATISYRHAQVIIEAVKTLPSAARAGFEEAVLPEAVRLPVARFRKVAVRVREFLHPDSIADRTRAATEQRRFVFDPAEDGMAWVSAYLPADRAQALFNRVTSIAKSLQQEGESRTLPQLRADVAADLLLEGRLVAPEAGSGRDATAASRSERRTAKRRGKRRGANWGIRPTVIVTVPVMTLLGNSEEPGHLDGYGPIDADTARRLAARAPSLRRLLVHPETGVALSLGTKHYRPTADLRLWLQLRDGVCRFPGCTRPAIHSDLDHSRAAEFGGPTEPANLSALCGPHHRLKHATTWAVENQGDGILGWTSPTGKTYTTYPATVLPHPQPPPQPTVDLPAPRVAAIDLDPPPPRDDPPPPMPEPGMVSAPPDPVDEAPPF